MDKISGKGYASLAAAALWLVIAVGMRVTSTIEPAGGSSQDDRSDEAPR